MFKAQCWRKKQLPYDLSALHNSAGFPAGRKEKETELVERTGSIATAWGKMKKRKEIPELHPNRAFTYFVEQNFPIKKTQRFGDMAVECICYEGKETHQHLLCKFFHVEVVKDYEGEVSYITVGVGWNEDRNVSESIDIIRTTDFNAAYGLKIKLDDLLGRKVSKYEKMPCYGGLQRKQLPFD